MLTREELDFVHHKIEWEGGLSDAILSGYLNGLSDPFFQQLIDEAREVLLKIDAYIGDPLEEEEE